MQINIFIYTEMKNEASWHIKSLQALFEDRVSLLREQAAGKG
jgi:hypothetical protein